MTAKRKRGPGRPPGITYPERMNIPVTEAQLERYEQAASSMATSLSDWVRAACEAFAKDEGGRRR